jgi:hypothetical protein
VIQAKSILAAILVVSLCALPVGSFAAGPAAVAAAPAAKPPVKPAPAKSKTRQAPVRVLKNSHLHVPSTAKIPSAKHRRTARVVHTSIRHPRIVFHRGYGIVTGAVRDSANRPVAGAHVWLMWPKGRAFRSRRARHATITNAAGGFAMHRVRPRAYRVGATKKNVGHGHAGVRLASGASAPPVLIKFVPAAAPTRRRHK